MNDVLEQMLTEGTAIGEDGNTVQIFTASISREDGEALAKVIKATGARRTLEIGFAYGVSTLFILDALKESGGGHHTAIDPFEADGYGNVGLRSVQRAGFEDSFTFHQNYSQDLLPQFLIAGEKFDFIFIDGHHTFDDTMNDFYYCEKILKDGGVICFHDIRYFPSVRKVITFVLRNMNYEPAMDLILPAATRLDRIKRTVRMIAHYPWDPFCWRLADAWRRANLFVVRRRGPDNRRYDHYRPF